MPSEWSSPIRRAGSRLLDPIPFEIYSEIFSYISDSEDMSTQEERRSLSNLALVCRYFSSIALPRIFAEIRLWGKGSGGQSLTMSNLCRAIVNDQEPANSIVQYITSCMVLRWKPESDESTHIIRSHDVSFTMHCTTLSKMIHLESLFFKDVCIDKQLLKAISKLNNLKSLRMVFSYLSHELDHDEILNFTYHLKLETLVINNPAFWSPDTHRFTDYVNYQSLKTLVVPGWNIIRHLEELPDNLQLEDLTVYKARDPYLIPKMFAKMPELRRVHFPRVFTFKLDDLASLNFQSLVPKLCVVDCPAALAALLVPSRPVKKVRLGATLTLDLGWDMPVARRLFLEQLDQTFLEALQQSSATIEEIAIPKHLYAAGDLKAYMPGVSMLKISWCHVNWEQHKNWNKSQLRTEMNSLFGMWTPNPKIRYLTLDFGFSNTKGTFLDLPLQFDILENVIVKAFPNIEQVNFIPIINWRRPTQNEGWKVYVPRAEREYACRGWAAMREQLVDYRECFAEAFKAYEAEPFS